MKLDFVGAAATEPVACAPAPGVVSYFGSTPERSHTAIPTYSGVTYPNLWPGIDATYSGTGSKLEYTFVVHPGADPSQIRLAYLGADAVHLNDKVQVEVSTAAGAFTDDRPTSFQDLDGNRVAVS
ncbi:MAG: hypothetical protein LC808_06715, partial [Actinobacteria bacterium]|nr:hypothetical protein [Actinomycetota bacterium]